MLEDDWVERKLQPPEQVSGQWTWRRVRVGPIHLWLVHPADPDQLLNDPGTLEANAREDYMPYWAYSWSASEALVQWLIEHPELVRRKRVLELGCGLGFVSLVAAQLGARVTASDHSRAALAAVATSARRNGLTIRTLCFDWRRPPARSFPLILAADVLYEPEYPAVVAACLRQMLIPSGEALIADPCRFTANGFPEEASRQGLAVTTLPLPVVSNQQHRLFHVRNL